MKTEIKCRRAVGNATTMREALEMRAPDSDKSNPDGNAVAMRDTHGATGDGWYGFDLDGTLAKYDGWKGIDHIGEPVKPMVELIKRMHNEGKVVKIMTARVAPRILEDGTIGEQFTWLTREPSSDPAAKYTATQYIQDWCEESAQLGFIPEIVYQKDHLMLELYDDRVKQVVPNTGILVENLAGYGNAAAMREALVKIREKCVIYNNDLAEEIDAICGNALDLPRRNCDVGTVLEQTERQRHYCGQHYSVCDVDMECHRCPLEKEASCQLAWAQIPYTENEVRDGK